MATFDYTSRDFVSIRQDLIDRAARLVPEWNRTDDSDFANVLIDLWAYMGDILHFYVDRAAAETFLPTATQRESVLAIANLMDYVPASSRGAKGTVTFNVNSVPTNQTTYTVPQYTVFIGFDDDGNEYKYYSTTAITAASAGSQHSVTVVQGELINEESLGRSSGTSSQKINLTKKGVESTSVSVYVYEGPVDSSGNATAVTYQYVEQMSSAGYQDKVFTTRLTSDGYTIIEFGNGFNGAIPTTNAAITASYRATSGSLGNLSQNRITLVGGTPNQYISVVSSAAMSGGTDIESIVSIKENVSRLYRTQDRAVSLSDYQDLTLQTPGVGKATAVYQSNPSTGASVLVYPVPTQSAYPPAAVSNEVKITVPTSIVEYTESYLEDKSMVGVTAYVANKNGASAGETAYIECVPVYVAMTVNVLPNFVQAVVKENVTAAIRELLSFDNVFFDQRLSIGEVYRAALTVQGVDYVDIAQLNTNRLSSTVTNITPGVSTNYTSTKLLCFADDVNSTIAITLTMVGGLTGVQV
jgi:hypothetical protein